MSNVFLNDSCFFVIFKISVLLVKDDFILLKVIYSKNVILVYLVIDISIGYFCNSKLKFIVFKFIEIVLLRINSRINKVVYCCFIDCLIKKLFCVFIVIIRVLFIMKLFVVVVNMINVF